MNQPSAFAAIRPTAPPEAPRLVMPDTMVAKTSGAITILMSRRKTSDRTEK